MTRRSLTALLLCSVAAPAFAQNSTNGQPISLFPNATLPLSGGEFIPIVQNYITKKITAGTFITSQSPTLSGSALWTMNGTALASGYPTSPCGTQFGSSFYQLGICYDLASPPTVGGQVATLYVVNNTNTANTFGTAYARFALQISETKPSYLTSTNTQEIDGSSCTVWQGAQGDGGCGQFQAIKVRGSGSDSGGVLGIGDVVAEWVNPSGVKTWEVHDILSYGESAATTDGTAGAGFGASLESWLGVQYSALQISTFAGSGVAGAYGFKYAFAAWNDRSTTNQYFSIAGDQIGSTPGFAENPGDINIGLAAYALNFHTDGGGGIALRAGATTEFYLGPTGVGQFETSVAAPTVLATGASVAATGSQIAFGDTTTANTNCGTIGAGCVEFYIGTTAHYWTYY